MKNKQRGHILMGIGFALILLVVFRPSSLKMVLAFLLGITFIGVGAWILERPNK